MAQGVFEYDEALEEIVTRIFEAADKMGFKDRTVLQDVILAIDDHNKFDELEKYDFSTRRWANRIRKSRLKPVLLSEIKNDKKKYLQV
jgi:hypothetical protein